MHDTKSAKSYSLNDLAEGRHEKCFWCGRALMLVDGHLQFFTGLDGNRYCCEMHGSAPYLTRREIRL